MSFPCKNRAQKNNYFGLQKFSTEYNNQREKGEKKQDKNIYHQERCHTSGQICDSVLQKAGHHGRRWVIGVISLPHFYWYFSKGQIKRTSTCHSKTALNDNDFNVISEEPSSLLVIVVDLNPLWWGKKVAKQDVEVCIVIDQNNLK